MLCTSYAIECHVYPQQTGEISMPLNTAPTPCHGLGFKCPIVEGLIWALTAF